MHYLLDCEVKIKKTGRKAVVVDHINNHFALSTFDGKDIINKTEVCIDYKRLDLDIVCEHCSDGFFQRNLLEEI